MNAAPKISANTKVLFIHGKSDTLIKYDHSLALLSKLRDDVYCEAHFPDKMSHNEYDLVDDLVMPIYNMFRKSNLDTGPSN